MCCAVYGREPLLAITNCPEDHCYVLNLSDAVTEDEAGKFLDRVAAGTEPPAKKGAKPLPDDAFDDGFDIELNFVKCAVQSTYKQLVGRADRVMNEHRCIAVLFCDACPCCPPALQTLDYLFSLVLARAGRAEDSSVLLTIVGCNIDENELDAEDWPDDPNEQVVPLLNGYVNGNLTRFTGPKTGERLIQFVSQIFCGPQESAVQSMVELLRAAVVLDGQGRVVLPRSVSPVPGLGGKSKRTRSGRQLDASDVDAFSEIRTAESTLA